MKAAGIKEHAFLEYFNSTYKPDRTARTRKKNMALVGADTHVGYTKVVAIALGEYVPSAEMLELLAADAGYGKTSAKYQEFMQLGAQYIADCEARIKETSKKKSKEKQPEQNDLGESSAITKAFSDQASTNVL